MPSYNVEKYIGKAIESLQKQTESSWRLIIADDESSDRTVEVAQNYAVDDDRIKVVVAEENSGSAYKPRKKAILLAETEFVAPLDSDDWVEPDYLKKLLEKQESTNADIVYPVMYYAGNHATDINNIERAVPDESYTRAVSFKGEDLLADTLPVWKISAGGGLLRRSLYVKTFQDFSDIIVEENVFSDEFLTRCLLYTASVVAFAEADYYYRIHIGSITHRSLIRRLEYMPHVVRMITMIEQRSGKDSEVATGAHIKAFHSYFDLLRLMYVMDSNPEKFPEWKGNREMYIKEIEAIPHKLRLKDIRGKVSGKYMMLMRVRTKLLLKILPYLDRITGNTPHII